MIVNCVCDLRPIGPLQRAVIGLIVFGCLGRMGPAQAQPTDPLPDFVAISPQLHTAGQPGALALAELATQGYALVVNLAPADAPGAVADEASLLAANGVSYVNIPVAWQQPTAADFALFSAVLDGAADRKTLVHCALNRRASMFTFLHRVVREGVPPAVAYEDVTRVWTPNDVWRAFAQEILAEHAIEFELGAAP